jgi:hypothetical protein
MLSSAAAALLCLAPLHGRGVAATVSAKPFAFKAAPQGEFTFDTGVLRGKLRPRGKTLGLASVVHIPTGAMLDRGDAGYGLFSHYRVFSAGRRYGGGAWDWPSTARLREDGAVEVGWAAADQRPFRMRAVYRWSAADTLDLETVVQAESDLPRFESFLASYFDPQFTNCLVQVSALPEKPGQTGFLAAAKAGGDWQMFPRDAAALTVLADGRWKLEPNPVQWTIRPTLAAPIGVRRNPATGLTVALVAAAQDCFAIATPQQSEGHLSLYLSLFGRDLKAGETARARARLLVMGDLSEQKITDSQKALESTPIKATRQSE